MRPYIPHRLPPVVAGVCRAVHAVSPPPDAGPPPGEDISLAEVLSGHARVLALSIEAVAPGSMDRLRRSEPCGD